MAQGRSCGAAVVLAILVIAGAIGVVRAQTSTGCGSSPEEVSLPMFDACDDYLLPHSTMAQPTADCCQELSFIQTTHGSDCYCELLLHWQQVGLDVDMVRAEGLPQACNVTVNRTNCIAAPPVTLPFSPPALLPPPADLTPTPPGFTQPTIPDLLPSPPSKGKRSLAVPVGATAGGLTVGGVIIWVVYLIMSKCDVSLKWDLNQPCCCCHRKPKAHPESKPDIHRHNVPVNAYGYRV